MIKLHITYNFSKCLMWNNWKTHRMKITKTSNIHWVYATFQALLFTLSPFHCFSDEENWGYITTFPLAWPSSENHIDDGWRAGLRQRPTPPFGSRSYPLLSSQRLVLGPGIIIPSPTPSVSLFLLDHPPWHTNMSQYLLSYRKETKALIIISL